VLFCDGTYQSYDVLAPFHAVMKINYAATLLATDVYQHIFILGLISQSLLMRCENYYNHLMFYKLIVMVFGRL